MWEQNQDVGGWFPTWNQSALTSSQYISTFQDHRHDDACRSGGKGSDSCGTPMAEPETKRPGEHGRTHGLGAALSTTSASTSTTTRAMPRTSRQWLHSPSRKDFRLRSLSGDWMGQMTPRTSQCVKSGARRSQQHRLQALFQLTGAAAPTRTSRSSRILRGRSVPTLRAATDDTQRPTTDDGRPTTTVSPPMTVSPPRLCPGTTARDGRR